MSRHLQPVQVVTGSADTGSRLVFDNRYPVSALVRSSDEHKVEAGSRTVQQRIRRFLVCYLKHLQFRQLSPS